MATRIYNSGTTLATSTASSTAATAFPTSSGGTAPLYVRFATDGTIYVKVGADNTTTATTNDILITSGAPLIMDVRAVHYFAAIALTGTPKVNCVPVDSP